MTKRKFYRTTYQVEVLSEEPIPPTKTFNEIMEDTMTGHYSGMVGDGKVTELNGRQAADALREQASGVDFFNLDEVGNDLDPVDEDELTN